MKSSTAASETLFDDYLFTKKSLSNPCGYWFSAAPATDG